MDYQYDVFLSYKSVDQEWVIKLKNALVKAGISVWLDRDEIRPGDLFVEAIEKGLEASKSIAIVVSPEAMNSGWVKQEYIRAVSIVINSDKPRRLIPLLLRDATLPGFLQDRQWVDFRNEEEFDNSVQELIWGIQGDWVVESPPEGKILPLHEIMLGAQHSLIISGHTLDRFTHAVKVQDALVHLIRKDTHITLMLLNPLSAYSKAHDPFHMLESRTPAHTQIVETIDVFSKFFEAFGRPSKFEVLLTDYMPRFRTIIVDEEVCYINLYMYGMDVGGTPEFRLKKTDDGVNSSWFQEVSTSVHAQIESNRTISLIKNGRFNINWENSQAADLLDCYLSFSDQRDQTECRDSVAKIILGYQNDDPKLAYKLDLCQEGYEPGTFTLESITATAKFLETPMTFDTWIKIALENEMSLIEKAYPNVLQQYMSRHEVFHRVQRALECRPKVGDPLVREIWYQEYEDIIRRLLMTVLVGNPDFELEIYSYLTQKHQNFMVKVLKWLTKFREPELEDWIHLSIAGGLLEAREKGFHPAISTNDFIKSISVNQPDEDEEIAIQRVANELWEAAKTPCRIDATGVFLHTLKMNRQHKFRIVSFPSDYLETIILLKSYEEMIQHFPNLEIDCVPRSIRCGNDATYGDVLEFCNSFPALTSSGRFRVADNGPKLGGVNLLKLHPDIMALIDKATVLDVRGARSFETMQGINQETYFGFMVCREMSESLVGLSVEDLPFIYVRQGPGERSFDGFTSRHKRLVHNKKLAKTTVDDHKNRWNGGHLSQYSYWSEERKYRYEILRAFYSRNAPEFAARFGGLLEIQVKEFLDQFSGRVLVVGCGSGKEVQYIVKNGCDAFGIDFSPEAILLARAEHPKLEKRFFVEDFYNLDTIKGGEFDGIVANAALVHLLERDDILLVLKKMWGRLKNNGLCFIRIIEKEGYLEELDPFLFGDARWFVYYTEEELKQFAEKAGFIVERVEKHQHAQYDIVHWVSVLLRKSDYSGLKS